jgi:hypothetical protein
MIQTGSAAAIDKHLDQLEAVGNVFLAAVLIVLLTSARADKELALIGAKLDTDSAYSVVTALYDSIFVVVAAYLWRLSDFLMLAEVSDVEKCTASAFAHKWLLNPFSFNGAITMSRIISTLGICFLVLAWWVGLGSLAVLASLNKQNPFAHHLLPSPIPFISDSSDIAFTYVYLLLGVASLISIARFYYLLTCRFGDLKIVVANGREMELRKEAFKAGVYKFVATVMMTALGFYVYWQLSHIGA